MVKRKNQFTYWLRHKAEDCGIMQPPLKAQKAVDFLQTYLLGEDWYIVNPVNCEQGNSQVVHEILMKYSKDYRKEYSRECRRAKRIIKEGIK
jgi:hypothetical protein